MIITNETYKTPALGRELAEDEIAILAKASISPEDINRAIIGLLDENADDYAIYYSWLCYKLLELEKAHVITAWLREQVSNIITYLCEEGVTKYVMLNKHYSKQNTVKINKGVNTPPVGVNTPPVGVNTPPVGVNTPPVNKPENSDYKSCKQTLIDAAVALLATADSRIADDGKHDEDDYFICCDLLTKHFPDFLGSE